MKWRFASVGKNPLSPRPWMIPDRSSPSRVRYVASRPGLLRADQKGWLFMRGKGGKSLALSSHGHTIDSLPLMGIGNMLACWL